MYPELRSVLKCSLLLVDAPLLSGCPGERCASHLRLSSSDLLCVPLAVGHRQFRSPLCISRIHYCSLFYTLPVSVLLSASLFRNCHGFNRLSLRAGHHTAAGVVCLKSFVWNASAAFPRRSHSPCDRQYPHAVEESFPFQGQISVAGLSLQRELPKWLPSCL